MKKALIVLLLLFAYLQHYAQKKPVAKQKTIAQMKAGLEASPNPLAYARDTLKKPFKLDTIIITNSTHFVGLPDSLAYNGKLRKVYGPYDHDRLLVQVLGKLPNTFTRVSQIFLDTSTFTRRFADSLADNIIARVSSGAASFEDMARTYSMGGEGATLGDLGWVAKGAVLPQMDRELQKRKKGDIFKVWSKNGVHIIKKTSDPRQDTGFVLLLRVLLS